MKGISQLIDLAANNPDINIVIIGDGSQREFFKNYIKRLDLEKQVILYGKVKNGAIYSSLFDVYVQPSLSEGFGLAVIEAILNKTPVVCSDIPVFKEMFNSNEVEFFSINDISSLYYAIVKAYKYSDNRIDMAYKKVADEYSESGMVKKYMEWYEKFI
ncbi:glycosyltransferase [Pectobacterium cacticida]|uniref:glycosyltransferase n=1 Tax=Pectobacterium cacticida TaxID=69221 RepID=UPI0035F0067F